MKPLFSAFLLLAVFLLYACGASTSTGPDITSIQPVASDNDVVAEQSGSVAAEAAEDTETDMAAVSDVAVATDKEENALLAAESDVPSEAQPSDGTETDGVDETADESEVPENFIRCEVKIEQDDMLYQAQAIAPTLEEARDIAVEEACALPCAATLDAGVAEDDAEAKLESCTESCTESTIVVAAACHQNGKSIYTEGAWNVDGDAAPTNGEEAPVTSK